MKNSGHDRHEADKFDQDVVELKCVPGVKQESQVVPEANYADRDIDPRETCHGGQRPFHGSNSSTASLGLEAFSVWWRHRSGVEQSPNGAAVLPRLAVPAIDRDP